VTTQLETTNNGSNKKRRASPKQRAPPQYTGRDVSRRDPPWYYTYTLVQKYFEDHGTYDIPENYLVPNIQKYYADHGTCAIPENYLFPDNSTGMMISLRSWLKDQIACLPYFFDYEAQKYEYISNIRVQLLIEETTAEKDKEEEVEITTSDAQVLVSLIFFIVSYSLSLTFALLSYLLLHI
jgi:hypothetical protein